FGPENINIDVPENGTYRIGVHAFNGRRADSNVTVRVYCGARSTVPDATFGPVLLHGPNRQSQNDFWRVADVTFVGNDCTIADLAENGQPNIGKAFEAEMAR
ncbi:MAG: hypothetical protein KC417_08470, partial [Myxococcales bacterium]|nr:hypothetical protein [Myxococcales bacterium]